MGYEASPLCRVPWPLDRVRRSFKRYLRQPRHATHPINAILNYGYSMLAGQVERAAVIRGLDVNVGSLHAGSDGRPSLVYDLIEPLRPVLDAQVLGWVAGVRWRRADFVVTTEGKVRLSASLARVVAQKAWLDRRAVDGVVGWYAGVVMGRLMGPMIIGYCDESADQRVPEVFAVSGYLGTAPDWFELGRHCFVSLDCVRLLSF
jgi:CRISPR associated protein Cas1